MNPYKYSLTTRLKEKWVTRFLNVNLYQGSKILDLGCGMGYFLGRIYKNNIINYGSDLSFKSLLIAKNNLPDSHFICNSATELPFKDKSFDKILFSDVIEHLEFDEPALKEITRVLADEGKLIVTTPPLEGLLIGSKLNLLFHDKKGDPEYHFRVGYNTTDLCCRLKRHGFNIKAVKYSTVLLGEIFIELSKLVFSLRKNVLTSQADLVAVSNSYTFKFYKYFIFPFIFAISLLEDFLFSNVFKGHVLIVYAEKSKRD